MEKVISVQKLNAENERLREQLAEALDTIEAIRNGEIDALVVNGKNGHELYTLKTADHTYRVFIEIMTEGAVTINSEGVVVYSNTSFANMVGQASEKVVGELFERFVSRPDRTVFTRLIAEGWRGDGKGEVDLLKKDGSTIPVQLSITKLRMDEGFSLSIIITDLTGQREIMRQLKLKNDLLEATNIALELSNHDLQQFASVASHDLQEPLRKIQIFSHLLKDRFYSELNETSKQYVEKIESSANRMKLLIIDILNYSRLSVKDNLYAKTSLRMMIDELLEDLELVIKEKNATITVGWLPEVEINRGQMRQVFQNLISNALKFSKKDADPVIQIFAEEDSGPNQHCHIHVRDNGIGFDEKYSKSIFNLFEKLHSKDDYEGTGIGLAITKKIIEKHGGHIEVSSTIGLGTEFILTLPITQKPSIA